MYLIFFNPKREVEEILAREAARDAARGLERFPGAEALVVELRRPTAGSESDTILARIPNGISCKIAENFIEEVIISP